MPIVRVGSKVLYFAHVPKCAGTTVENHLKQRFGSLGFLDRAFLSHDATGLWNRSSPQHIDCVSLHRLLPPELFDASFAVVRHPALRLRSVFLYQRDVAGLIPSDAGFLAWVRHLSERRARDPFYLDNHPRPMTEIVPECAHVFPMEQGLHVLVEWLDSLSGTTWGGSLPHQNSREKILTRQGEALRPIVPLGPTVRELIAEQYAKDFERFGYDPDWLPDEPGEQHAREQKRKE